MQGEFEPPVAGEVGGRQFRQRGARDAAIVERGGDAGFDVADGQVFEIHGVPPWLGEIVKKIIAKMIALRVPGGPAAKMVPHMVSVWCEALMATGIAWNRELDEERLRRAWKSMLPHLESWPTPAVFLRHLPARGPQKSLPPPKPTDEEKERARAVLAEAARLLRGKHARRETGQE